MHGTVRIVVAEQRLIRAIASDVADCRIQEVERPTVNMADADRLVIDDETRKLDTPTATLGQVRRQSRRKRAQPIKR